MIDKKIAAEFTVGCDPEVFFLKDGRPFPAIGLVGGTKSFPRKLDVGAVQEDNVMAEFNIPPAQTEVDFNNRVARMLENVRKIAVKNGCSLYVSPYAEFEGHYLEHPQAQTIGCDPDYNAWKMCVNESPTKELLKNTRTASGHVHVGFKDPDSSPLKRCTAVKAMDLFLGIPSIILDSDTTRRKFYGKAGAFRPKEYGVEYRVLSNFWITNPYLRKWVFKNSIYALHQLKNIPEWEHREKYFSLIPECINEHNVPLAKEIIRYFNVQLPEVPQNDSTKVSSNAVISTYSNYISKF